MRPKEIGLIGFDQVTASHLAATADALRAAVLEDGFGGQIQCYRVWTIGLTREAFRSESGMVFVPDAAIATAPPLDTIIIAGGKGLHRPEIREPLTEWILSRAYETRRIGSICSGILALAPTGLLDGREVTTHWRLPARSRCIIRVCGSIISDDWCRTVRITPPLALARA